MKHIVRIGAFVVGMCAFAGVHAADSAFYAGVKVGQMLPDVQGLDNATNAGILIGYNFPKTDYGTFAVEGEYTTTISKGDAKALGLTGDWEVDTTSLYGVYRSAGDLYFKGKVGYLNEDIKVSIAGFSGAGTDSGGSLGIGGGWRFGDAGSIEAEYTIIEQDIDSLSLGVNMHF